MPRSSGVLLAGAALLSGVLFVAGVLIVLAVASRANGDTSATATSTVPATDGPTAAAAPPPSMMPATMTPSRARQPTMTPSASSVTRSTSPSSPLAAPSPTYQPPSAAQPNRREILVYFSRHPASDDDFGAVFPVTRTADDAGVARAAIQALISGPTPQEAAAGYFSAVSAMLVGPSTCADQSFTIRIEAGLATLQFCHLMQSAGIGQDARAMSSIEATLRQFPTIQRVRVLSRDGDCLFDMSGENRCLRDD